ncbi:hypothetical protein MYU51_015405 [Penicillium brevicompactum]|uniref:uncharacterized protein n=1 Tax=Penicillium brevicompactum TaxID=5074 RepID=UPI00254102C7|nr:uncharacterized protein N7506_001158 [Penicillium brevicompactum]KAJ5347905.1 hypothetical protein N7506_001158 [Penicillium brevicompactum]
MLQREFTTIFRTSYGRFRKSMHNLLYSLRSSAPYRSIAQQTDELFLRLSELRHYGEIMGRMDAPDEIVRNAPPGYFVTRAQQHRGFYGTEFGYSCWYIKASMGYSLGRLESGGSAKPIADFLETILADFDIRKMGFFPRSLPFEFGENQFPLLSSASQSPVTLETSAVSDDEDSVRSSPSFMSYDLKVPNNTPASSAIYGPEDYLTTSFSDADESPHTSASSESYDLRVPDNTPATSMYLATGHNLGRSISEDASIFAELADRAHNLASSLSRDTARPQGMRHAPRHSRRLRSPIALGRYRNYGSSTPETEERGRAPQIRMTTPNGTSQSPPLVKNWRRPSPYPGNGELWKRFSTRRASSMMPLSHPPPSPREDIEAQHLSLPTGPGSMQGVEQPFFTPHETHPGQE